MCKFKFFYKSLLIFIVISIVACGSDDNATSSPPTTNPEEGFQGTVEWVKTFGGSGEDDALSIVESEDGGYVVFGYTQSVDGDISDKDATDSDFWVLKISPEGTVVWSKTYGGTGDDRGQRVIKTNDGGYALVGYSRSADGDVSENAGLQDYWMVKIDASGNLQWEKSFGFPGIDRAFSIVQTADNGYFLTGFLDVTASNGEGNDNRKKSEKHGVGEFWGIKLDASGNKEWRRYFGGTNNDRSYDTVQTEDGGFLMIGSSESDDFDISSTKGSYDFWVVKINTEGTKVWEKSYGGSEIDVGYAIASSGDGKYVVVGDSRSDNGDISDPKGNADLWMIQIDGNGNLIWEKSLGGTEFDTARGIHTTQDGSFIITGNSRSNNGDVDENQGQSDIWNILIDSNGDVTWKSTLGGSLSEFAEGCMETQDKKIIIAGNSESNDLDIPNNRGGKDVLIIKYK
ncbi:hypothetical protein D1818_14810 [Aquimarina sp. BL5]|uniref:hypothetical protein n=1 Tax=Aquimarina sp. BL5 TaxID=1714860 RepID=UPI000E4BB2B2|nr:hypothetical protein [Aquimarina sp. BL5]AXT52046.1 hypothetical protein D1818_14810 [Aquimarina sp. BL5]RKN11158.1 hypothetical protein D7036_01605 [Aquimarina sp. BL5]